MRNKAILLLMFIIVLIFSLLVFSCKNTESGTMLDENTPVSEGKQESIETDTGEVVQDDENDLGEEIQDVGTSQPVQIIDISPEEVFEILENNEDYLLLDVRTQEEYNTGHIEGAMLLPVQELEERLEELPKDKSIIVYCRSGARSRRAAETLVANGFAMVYDMGGINSWIEEEYPVIEGNANSD